MAPGYYLTFKSPIANRQSPIPSGFTLLEVMISLTIMALILVLVFGAFRVGSRAWEKGEKDVEIHQRERVVLDLLKRQIASACPRLINFKDQDPFYMRGDSRTLEFITCISANQATSGLVFVKYEVRESDTDGFEKLLLYEKGIVRLTTDRNPEEWEENETYPLIHAAQEIRFGYLGPVGDEQELPEWQDAWDPEKDKGLPMAIKVVFRSRNRSTPVVVLARLMSPV